MATAVAGFDADEGMTPDTMGKSRDMEQFLERQRERPVEVPWDVERQNAMSDRGPASR